MSWQALAVFGVVYAVGVGAGFFDLARHEVRHLPKWAWALIIGLVSFPIGLIVYVVVGRASDDEPVVLSPAEEAGGALVQVSPPPRPPATGESVVATRSLSKRYGDVVALDDVDLEVPEAATYGLIGPNGAGKTTLLSILSGLRRPSGGRVDLAVATNRIAFLVDTPQFEPWLTGREVVALAHDLIGGGRDDDRVEAVLARTGLADVADRRVGGYSRGMLQRVGLASCLVGDPAVLVLDEPSSALDPAGRREVLDLIGRLARDRTVILSTHILGDVQQVCDVVGVLDRGRLAFQGPLSDLLARTGSAFVVHVRPPADGLIRALRAESWVAEVSELAPGRLRVHVSDASVAEAGIPKAIAAAGAALVSLNPAADLETAFLELTS